MANCVNIMDIFVGNLPFSTQEEDLLDLFSTHGTVERAKIMLDRETGRSRGFAFITMPDDGEANAAIEALAGQDFQGRPLRVNAAEDRPPARKPGGFGGGGGFNSERRGGFNSERRGGGGGGKTWERRDSDRGRRSGGGDRY